VTLVGVEDGRVRIRLEGGCQGCSLAEVTLRQGIEPVLRAKVQGVVGLTDVTDHEAGREPFYSAAKR
jgi:Fe-S cluster biogenesis protein NfuA